MKKFFALMLVVAMLAVTGTAMAADPILESSLSTVVVVAGHRQTATLTATRANNNGQLGTITKTVGPEWATINGNTLTVNPGSGVTAGNYTVVASVTETVETREDIGGHGTPVPVTRSYSASLPITVSVQAPTVVSSTGTTVVTVTVKEEKVTGTTQVQAQVVTATVMAATPPAKTFVDVIKTVATAIADAISNVISGLSETIAQTWSNTTKLQAVENAVEAAANKEEVKEDLKAGLPPDTVVTKQPSTNLVPAQSSTPSTATKAEKQAAATQQLGANSGRTAVATTEAVKPSQPGTYSFNNNFGREMFGKWIGGSRNPLRNLSTTAGAFSVAEFDDKGVVFLNSSGDKVDTIPDDSDPDNIMPGYVNMLVVMEADTVYEPIIFVSSDKVSKDETPVTATVNTVEVTETKTKAAVNSSGTVEGQKEVEQADNNVTSAILTALGAPAGTIATNVFDLDTDTVTTITSKDKTAQSTAGLALSTPVHVAYVAPWQLTNLTDGYYYMNIDASELNNTIESGYTTADTTTYSFYPDGISATAKKAKFTLVNGSGGAVTPTTSGTVYLGFQVSNGEVVAAAGNSLTLPTLAFTVKKAETLPEGDHGTSSSSGGCSAGSAALALAVLGSFIVMRKK